MKNIGNASYGTMESEKKKLPRSACVAAVVQGNASFYLCMILMEYENIECKFLGFCFTATCCFVSATAQHRRPGAPGHPIRRQVRLHGSGYLERHGQERTRHGTRGERAPAEKKWEYCSMHIHLYGPTLRINTHRWVLPSVNGWTLKESERSSG